MLDMKDAIFLFVCLLLLLFLVFRLVLFLGLYSGSDSSVNGRKSTASSPPFVTSITFHNSCLFFHTCPLLAAFDCSCLLLRISKSALFLSFDAFPSGSYHLVLLL